jgi:hypothetical protein
MALPVSWYLINDGFNDIVLDGGVTYIDPGNYDYTALVDAFNAGDTNGGLIMSISETNLRTTITANHAFTIQCGRDIGRVTGLTSERLVASPTGSEYIVKGKNTCNFLRGGLSVQIFSDVYTSSATFFRQEGHHTDHLLGVAAVTSDQCINYEGSTPHIVGDGDIDEITVYFKLDDQKNNLNLHGANFYVEFELISHYLADTDSDKNFGFAD